MTAIFQRITLVSFFTTVDGSDVVIYRSTTHMNCCLVLLNSQSHGSALAFIWMCTLVLLRNSLPCFIFRSLNIITFHVTIRAQYATHLGTHISVEMIDVCWGL